MGEEKSFFTLADHEAVYAAASARLNAALDEARPQLPRTLVTILSTAINDSIISAAALAVAQAREGKDHL